MASTRSPSVLLVNYCGAVMTANTFIPDNSLAILAGALMQHGIPVRIADFQNPADIGSIMDHAEPTAALEVLDRLSDGEAIDAELYREYRGARERGQRAFEAEATERLLEWVATERVTVVGFKLWGGGGLAGSLRMAEAIRAAFPDVVLVAGGPAVTYAGSAFRRRSDVFDHLVVGDGEEAIVDLALGRVAAGDQVLKLGRRKRPGGGVAYSRDLDSVPAPVYRSDVYPNIDRFFNMRIIDDSRGCFNRCSFCAHPHLNGVTRKKSPTRVVDEIQAAHEQDGVTYFRFSGSNPPWKHLLAIADEITRRGLDICYGAYSSMNNVKPDDMERLARSGLRGLFFGIESGDPYLLKHVHNKNNVDVEHVERTVEAAMNAGIFTCLSVIVPSPFETEWTRRRTFDLLRRVFTKRRHGSVLVLPAFLTPGSDWWKNRSRYGFSLREGYDDDGLVAHLLDWDWDFLLPRDLAPDAGYTLNGKSCHELFDECASFVDQLRAEGISTNMDDASYMIGLMGDQSADRYQSSMLTHLIRGGAAPLTGLVDRMNAASRQARRSPGAVGAA